MFKRSVLFLSFLIGAIIGLLLILLGALSNFFDRLAYGYVIDYFYLKNFTIFNLADASISGGAILALIGLNKKPS